MTQRQRSYQKTVKTRLPLLFFWILLLLAVGLRFYKLGSVPVSLYWDETAILLDAKTIASNGLDMHGNHWFRTMLPSYGDYKLPVYIWLAALSIKLLGVSGFALRMPSAVAGVGTVLVTGAILHQLLGLYKKEVLFKNDALFKNLPQSWITLTGCLLMAITPWSIMFSRTGFEGHLGQFFVGLSILLVLHSPKRRWLVLISILLGSVATYTYFSVRFVWPVVFVASYMLAQSATPIKQKGTKVSTQIGLHVLVVVFCLGAYLLSLQPMFNSPLYAASNQFRLSTTSVLNSTNYAIQANILKEQAGNTIIDKIIFNQHWLLLRELAKNYSDNLDFSYLFISGDPNLRHGTGSHGVLLVPMLPLLLWGIYVLAAKKPQILLFLLIWWLAGLLPASVPEDTPHALRSLNALIPVVLLLSFGALDFLSRFKSNKSSLLLKGSIAVLAMSLLLASFSFTYHYFSIYPKQSSHDWQDGYVQLAEY